MSTGQRPRPIAFGPGPIGAWDLLTITAAAVALYLAGVGYRWLGLCVYASALVGFVAAIVWNPRLPVLLPVTFGARFVIGAIGMLVAVAGFGNERPGAAMLTIGSVIYYDACGSLIEGKVRYIPYGAGVIWKTAERLQRPWTYWSLMAMFLTLAMIFLVGAYGAAAGWFPLREHR